MKTETQKYDLADLERLKQEAVQEFYESAHRRAVSYIREGGDMGDSLLRAMHEVLEEMRFEEWKAVVIEFMLRRGWPHEAVSGENWDYWKRRYYDDGVSAVEALLEEVKVKGERRGDVSKKYFSGVRDES